MGRPLQRGLLLTASPLHKVQDQAGQLLRGFLRHETPDAGDPDQATVRDRGTEAFGHAVLEPLVGLPAYDQGWHVEGRRVGDGEILCIDRRRQDQQVAHAVESYVRGQVAGDQLPRHMGAVGYAALEDRSEQRGRAQDPRRNAQHEPRRVALQGPHIGRRRGLGRQTVDENEVRYALAANDGEPQRDGTTQVDADDVGVWDPERRQRAIDVFHLCGDAEIGVGRAIGLAIPQQIERDGRVTCVGDLGRDVAPQKARRAEPMQEDDRRAPVSVSLDVDCTRTDWQTKQVGLDTDLARKYRFVAALCAGS
jgi:hypothetical protein